MIPDHQAALRQFDEHIDGVKLDIKALYHAPEIDLLALGEAMFHLGRVKGIIYKALGAEIEPFKEDEKSD